MIKEKSNFQSIYISFIEIEFYQNNIIENVKNQSTLSTHSLTSLSTTTKDILKQFFSQ
jgi:hypothetical protein